MNLIGTIKSYGKIDKPIRLVIAAEFFIQLINIVFMNMQPLFMKDEGYSNPEIASLTATRFAGVLLFALPLGIIIRGKKVKGLFMLSAIFVPLFALCNVFFIQFHNTMLVHISQFLWGASFTFMQIPIIPFILRNCKKEQHTAGIALSYSTYSFAGIVSGVLITLLDVINPVFFDEKMVLVLFSISGFIGVWTMSKVQMHEKTVEKKHKIKLKGSYDWLIITKALIPTMIIAMGAGLTIPFISLFFEEVHHFDKGDFSVISSIAAVLVAWAALMVPTVKNTIGYKIAIPMSQSLAVISLVALATTQYYNHVPVAVVIAVICYLLRQPLMNMAGPMTTEVVMSYVGKKNQEIVSALISAIWSGSYFLSGIFVAILFTHNVTFVNVFLITASLYALGVIWYYLLILDYNKRERLGLIEKFEE
ncbi:MAG: MFS transporter [Bacteroidota bacterium]|nr:MFS transporter [Bacteroidota bacterium]